MEEVKVAYALAPVGGRDVVMAVPQRRRRGWGPSWRRRWFNPGPRNFHTPCRRREKKSLKSEQKPKLLKETVGGERGYIMSKATSS